MKKIYGKNGYSFEVKNRTGRFGKEFTLIVYKDDSYVDFYCFRTAEEMTNFAVKLQRG